MRALRGGEGKKRRPLTVSAKGGPRGILLRVRLSCVRMADPPVDVPPVLAWPRRAPLSPPSSKHAGKLASPNPLLGYGLCLANLALDGYTNTKQVRMRGGTRGGAGGAVG